MVNLFLQLYKFSGIIAITNIGGDNESPQNETQSYKSVQTIDFKEKINR